MTLTRAQASEEAKALVLALRDVIRNEEAWEVADRFLQAAWNAGWREARRD